MFSVTKLRDALALRLALMRPPGRQTSRLVDLGPFHAFNPSPAAPLARRRGQEGEGNEKGSSGEASAGFELTERGVFRLIQKRDDATGELSDTRRFVCSPMRILGRMRRRDGLGWGLVCSVQNPDGDWKNVALPASLFASGSPAVLSVLFDAGLRAGPGRDARAGVLHYLEQAQPSGRLLRVSGRGWVDPACAAFVFGDDDVIGAQRVIVTLDGPQIAATEMRAAGTLEDWKRHVAALAMGNPLIIVATASAFCGPLLDLVGAKTFGVHLREQSSSAASAALQMARSVWSAPAFSLTMASARADFQGIPAALNGALLCLSECEEPFSPFSRAALAALASQHCPEHGGDLSLASRGRLVILSSGATALGDDRPGCDRRAQMNQVDRLIELDAEGRGRGRVESVHGFETAAAFRDGVTTGASAYYGTAARAFVAKAIAEGRSRVERRLSDLMCAFREAANTLYPLREADGQVRSVAEIFSLIGAAGELAIAWDITGWPQGSAEAAALEIFGDWLASRSGSVSQERSDAIERTRGFLLSHGEARFVPLGGQDVDVAEQAGWVDQESFFILPAIWRSIHDGFEPSRAARNLADAKLLRPGGERDRLTVRVDRVKGRPRAYQVARAILSGVDGPTIDFSQATRRAMGRAPPPTDFTGHAGQC